MCRLVGAGACRAAELQNPESSVRRSPPPCFAVSPREQHAARAAASHCCSGGVNAEPSAASGDPLQPSPADCSLLSLPSPPPSPSSILLSFTSSTSSSSSPASAPFPLRVFEGGRKKRIRKGTGKHWSDPAICAAFRCETPLHDSPLLHRHRVKTRRICAPMSSERRLAAR